MINIEFASGTIFKSPAQVLVNPVNTVGVMGAGLALQFKNKYPENYGAYAEYCKTLSTFTDYDVCVFTEKAKIIYNLPTKEHYNQFSSLGKVRRSLINLVKYLNQTKPESIALPPIGCGLGGLGEANVLHLIIYHLRRVEHSLKVYLYGFKPKPTVKKHIIQNYDFEYRELDKYCGVGSRDLPTEVEPTLYNISNRLNVDGFTLSTGDASLGADAVFWQSVNDRKFRFGPVGRKPKSNTIVVTETDDAYSVAVEISSIVHPAWRFLPPWAKELHTRNVFEVLGRYLSEPAEFLVCWTPDGAIGKKDVTKKTGGTGTAINLASRFGIPVFNLKNEDSITQLSEFLGIDF